MDANRDPSAEHRTRPSAPMSEFKGKIRAKYPHPRGLTTTTNNKWPESFELDFHQIFRV